MLLADSAPQDLTAIRNGEGIGRREITTAAKLGHFFLFELWVRAFQPH
jgi:hypothetical protein